MRSGEWGSVERILGERRERARERDFRSDWRCVCWWEGWVVRWVDEVGIVRCGAVRNDGIVRGRKVEVLC